MTILCGHSLTIPATVGNPGKINRTVGVQAIAQAVATGTVRVRLPAPDLRVWVTIFAPIINIRYVRPPVNGPPSRDVAQFLPRRADPRLPFPQNHPRQGPQTGQPPTIGRALPRALTTNPTHNARR